MWMVGFLHGIGVLVDKWVFSVGARPRNVGFGGQTCVDGSVSPRNRGFGGERADGGLRTTSFC